MLTPHLNNWYNKYQNYKERENFDCAINQANQISTKHCLRIVWNISLSSWQECSQEHHMLDYISNNKFQKDINL